MPDISMCADMKCPSRGECHRYCAEPSKFLQSYGLFQRPQTDERCSYFWSRRSYDRRLEVADAAVPKDMTAKAP